MMRAYKFDSLSLSRAGDAQRVAGHTAPASGGQQPLRRQSEFRDIVGPKRFAPPQAERTPVRLLCGRRLRLPLAGSVARAPSSPGGARTDRPDRPMPGAGKLCAPPSDRRDEDGHSDRDTHEGPAVLIPVRLLLALVLGCAIGVAAYLLVHGGGGG